MRQLDSSQSHESQDKTLRVLNDRKTKVFGKQTMLYHFAGSDSISLILVTITEFFRKCSDFNNCEYINTDK